MTYAIVGGLGYLVGRFGLIGKTLDLIQKYRAARASKPSV